LVEGSLARSDSQGVPSGGQKLWATCRGEGLVAREHVPDRFGEPAGDLYAGDLLAALFAEPLGGLLVALAVASGHRREAAHATPFVDKQHS
jgi:hypothetical protein